MCLCKCMFCDGPGTYILVTFTNLLKQAPRKKDNFSMEIDLNGFSSTKIDACLDYLSIEFWNFEVINFPSKICFRVFLGL